jgi:hypothetical protein
MKALQSIGKMSSKWFEVAQRLLGEGDEIQKSYEGKIDGKFGWLILSDKKIMFIHESGFISKTYSIIFEIPRENIQHVIQEGSYELSITDITGNNFRFKTFEYHVDIILDNIQSSEIPAVGVM